MPDIKLVIVIEAEPTKAINQRMRDFMDEASKRNGSKIVGEPIEKLSGVDHQKINEELDKNRRPTAKDWYLSRPNFIAMR